jgi:signal peptidase I
MAEASLKEKFNAFWKRFWFIIWKDESLLGWIVSLLFAFLIIKFIFFPGLALIFGASTPLVVVESSSMHHSGNFLLNYLGAESMFKQWWQQSGEWYENVGISEQDAEKWQLRTGLEIGDVAVVWRAGNLHIGDVIVFNADQKYPIIHRIINISEVNGRTVYSTKGDNNMGQLFVEQRIPEDAIIGKAVFRIPVIGWVKLVFVKLAGLVTG